MTNRWLEIRYKCKCLTAERDVHIVARDDLESVIEFMDRVQFAVTKDHRARSPRCLEVRMEYVKVPVTGDKVGGSEGGTA